MATLWLEGREENKAGVGCISLNFSERLHAAYVKLIDAKGDSCCMILCLQVHNGTRLFHNGGQRLGVSSRQSRQLLHSAVSPLQMCLLKQDPQPPWQSCTWCKWLQEEANYQPRAGSCSSFVFCVLCRVCAILRTGFMWRWRFVVLAVS